MTKKTHQNSVLGGFAVAGVQIVKAKPFSEWSTDDLLEGDARYSYFAQAFVFQVQRFNALGQDFLEHKQYPIQSIDFAKLLSDIKECAMEIDLLFQQASHLSQGKFLELANRYRLRVDVVVALLKYELW